jgi:hypothetical protein
VKMALHYSSGAMPTLPPPLAASQRHRSKILRFCHLLHRPGLLLEMP